MNQIDIWMNKNQFEFNELLIWNSFFCCLPSTKRRTEPIEWCANKNNIACMKWNLNKWMNSIRFRRMMEKYGFSSVIATASGTKYYFKHIHNFINWSPYVNSQIGLISKARFRNSIFRARDVYCGACLYLCM